MGHAMLSSNAGMQGNPMQSCLAHVWLGRSHRSCCIFGSLP